MTWCNHQNRGLNLLLLIFIIIMHSQSAIPFPASANNDIRRRDIWMSTTKTRCHEWVKCGCMQTPINETGFAVKQWTESDQCTNDKQNYEFNGSRYSRIVIRCFFLCYYFYASNPPFNGKLKREKGKQKEKKPLWWCRVKHSAKNSFFLCFAIFIHAKIMHTKFAWKQWYVVRHQRERERRREKKERGETLCVKFG